MAGALGTVVVVFAVVCYVEKSHKGLRLCFELLVVLAAAVEPCTGHWVKGPGYVGC